MNLLLRILQYNDMISSIIAFIANLTLLYLIITVKNLTIKKLKYILLPSCAIDTVLSVMTFALEPQVVNIGVNVYIMVGSPLNILGFQAAAILSWTYVSLIDFYLNGVCIPFYLRYLVICKNKTLSLKHIVIPYAILFITYVINFVGYSFNVPAILEDDISYRQPTWIPFWLEVYPNGPVFVAARIHDWFVVQVVFISATLSLSYMMVIYFTIKINQTLKVHVHAFPETKLLHKQIQKTLIIQASAPLLIANGPILIIIGMMVLNIENLTAPLILCIPQGWICLVNPLAAIIIIKPYRRKLAVILKFLKVNKNQSDVINIATSTT